MRIRLNQNFLFDFGIIVYLFIHNGMKILDLILNSDRDIFWINSSLPYLL